VTMPFRSPMLVSRLRPAAGARQGRCVAATICIPGGTGEKSNPLSIGVSFGWPRPGGPAVVAGSRRRPTAVWLAAFRAAGAGTPSAVQASA